MRRHLYLAHGIFFYSEFHTFLVCGKNRCKWQFLRILFTGRGAENLLGKQIDGMAGVAEAMECKTAIQGVMPRWDAV
jgi:hypothetical protein